MEIKQMSLGPLGTNCYIIKNEKNEALIIDPGGDREKIEQYIESNSLIPLAIILTHAHFDHIGAVDDIRKKYDIDVYIHPKEKTWLSDAKLNRSLFFIGESVVTDGPEHLLRTGEMKIGSFLFEVLHTPGHSPGGVSLVFHNEAIVFTGDALFCQGIGRTDLPGGDAGLLQKSIKEKLFTLPDSYTAYPGHGQSTTIGSEKINNPYVFV